MKLVTKIVLVSMIASMLLFLTSCGKFKCDICGKEKDGSKHNETILGREVTMCDDCYSKYKAGADLLGGLFG